MDRCGLCGREAEGGYHDCPIQNIDPRAAKNLMRAATGKPIVKVSDEEVYHDSQVEG